MSSAICFNFDRSKMLSSGNGLTPLPNDKIVGILKSKVFCNDRLNFTVFLIIIVIEREEHILRNGESACYMHFSFSHIVLSS